MTVLNQFFTQYVFGHDRAELLAAQLPATDADHEKARARAQARLDKEINRIDTAERALISELEDLADPDDRAGKAYRARLRARNADLYTERTRIQIQLAELQAAAPRQPHRPARPATPRCPGVHLGPARVQEASLTAFDIQILYRRDPHQVTITNDTPHTITALLDDPRTDHDTDQPTPDQNDFHHSAASPMLEPFLHVARRQSEQVASITRRRLCSAG